MKAKKILALVLTLAMVVSLMPMAFAADAEQTFWDLRNTENVTASELDVTVDGVAVAIDRYQGHYYNENEKNTLTIGPGKYGPSGDRDDCQVVVYVPEGANDESGIMFLLENGSWAQSGLKTDVITDGAAFDSTVNDRVALALKYNMVVVSYGARCRGSVNADSEYVGHSPAVIADTKAAIRYIKYNVELGNIPGDADKVVISGHSGGGALGAIIAATGNSSDFDEYLVNAAPATDDVFAVMSSAPITDLAYADFAYEWTFGDYRAEAPYDSLSYDKYDEDMMALSETLAAKYVTYISDMFGLTEAEYTAKLNEIFEASVQHEIDLAAKYQYAGADGVDLRPADDERGWYELDADGNVVAGSFDLEAYTTWLINNAGITKPRYAGNELKGIMAFNSEGMKNGYNRNENNLWGTPAQAYSIAYPELWDMVKDPAAIGVDKYDSWDAFWAAEGALVGKQMKMVSVMPYLTGSDNMWYLEGADASGDKSDVAPNWFIRHGMGDADTAYSVVASLMLAVEEAAAGEVNAYFGWERGHNGGGNTYYLEFFQWMEDNGWIEKAENTDIADATVTTITPSVDGEKVAVKWYADGYLAAPNSDKQMVNVYVPENATEDSPIMFYVNNSGWMQNNYPTNTIEDGKDYDGTNDRVGVALKEGYVVVSYGCRSRTDATIGHSPATMTDTKAVIRYLRANADAITGDMEKIVITGTSGGGALSVIIAASGNSEDYFESLYEVGAAGIVKNADGTYTSTIRDDIWATIAYCPITDLGNACAAYDWTWGAARTQLMAEGKLSYKGATAEQVNKNADALTAIYEEYLDSLKLESVSAANLEATIIELMKAEIDESISEFGIDAMKEDLEDADWLIFNEDGTYTYDYDKHTLWVAQQTALKISPAFSNVGTGYGEFMNEDNLFGAPTDVYSPFNEYSWSIDATENAVGQDDTDMTWDEYMATEDGERLALQIKMTNPIPYLLDAEDGDSAPYWYVRYGMADRDSSFAVEAVLNAAMQADQSIKAQSFEFTWLEGHGGNYDVPEAYAWLKMAIEAEDAVATNQKATVDGEAIAPEVYNVAGNNYFKLRDIAAALVGTDAEFAIEIDAAKKIVKIDTTGKYTAVGGELEPGADKSATAVTSEWIIYVDGKIASVAGYNIGGNNFFKLRDLGAALGFGVDYDYDARTMLITTK